MAARRTRHPASYDLVRVPAEPRRPAIAIPAGRFGADALPSLTAHRLILSQCTTPLRSRPTSAQTAHTYHIRTAHHQSANTTNRPQPIVSRSSTLQFLTSPSLQLSNPNSPKCETSWRLLPHLHPLPPHSLSPDVTRCPSLGTVVTRRTRHVISPPMPTASSGFCGTRGPGESAREGCQWGGERGGRVEWRSWTG